MRDENIPLPIPDRCHRENTPYQQERIVSRGRAVLHVRFVLTSRRKRASLNAKYDAFSSSTPSVQAVKDSADLLAQLQKKKREIEEEKHREADLKNRNLLEKLGIKSSGTVGGVNAVERLQKYRFGNGANHKKVGKSHCFLTQLDPPGLL